MVIKILFLLWLVCVTAEPSCPPNENIAPSCICRVFDTFSVMTCNNIMSTDQLIRPIRATQGYEIFSIVIEDSSLLYIPSDIFKNTHVGKVYFRNSQVMALSDSDLAFEGLENSLEEIIATSTQYVTTWDWSQLRNLKKLWAIKVDNIGMHTVDKEFPHLQYMSLLEIRRAKISFLHPDAFSGLPNLAVLILKQNEISKFKRSMLPDPANKLHHLDLSHNLLETLPENMFKNMPNLGEIYLSHNKLLTLNEETFSPVIKKLQLLMLTGNALQCDCRMRWIVGYFTHLHLEGECEQPPPMRGRTLRYLKHIDFYC
nr:vasorin-like isoform X2 [Parasteatoda tepidariorum]